MEVILTDGRSRTLSRIRLAQEGAREAEEKVACSDCLGVYVCA